MRALVYCQLLSGDNPHFGYSSIISRVFTLDSHSYLFINLFGILKVPEGPKEKLANLKKRHHMMAPVDRSPWSASRAIWLTRAILKKADFFPWH